MPERYVGTFLGRFRLDSLVGSGGFAWVYRGYDPELDIPVAVKVLKPQFAGDEAFEGRFRREASTSAKLRHPNIVRILTVGRQGDAVYTVMDFLPSSLVDRLRVQGTLPDAQLIRLGMDVADALAFAHRQGVIHRDIKVDNIMFDDHGNAVVVDFGIARATATYVQQTGTGMVVGTPQYFSPEQARGLPLDGRADLYSLGVTLFRAATGRLPFEADDWYEMARMHVEEPPPKPRGLNPTLPSELEDVILRLLEKDREDRPATGEALRDELAALLPSQSSGHSAHTLLISTAERTAARRATGMIRRAKRRVREHGVLLGILLLSTAAITVALTRDRVPSATGAVRQDESATVARADSTTGGTAAPGTPAVVPDPATPPTPTPADSTPARPRFATLRLRAPTGAAITLNGQAVGKTSWRSDTLPAGQYEAVATVIAVPGCTAARDRKSVSLELGDTESVTLNPRACGFLELESEPRGADYEITPAAGIMAPRGRLSVAQTVMVPVGTYQVTISAPRCAAYVGAMEVAAGETKRKHVPLVCQ